MLQAVPTASSSPWAALSLTPSSLPPLWARSPKPPLLHAEQSRLPQPLLSGVMLQCLHPLNGPSVGSSALSVFPWQCGDQDGPSTPVASAVLSRGQDQLELLTVLCLMCPCLHQGHGAGLYSHRCPSKPLLHREQRGRERERSHGKHLLVLSYLCLGGSTCWHPVPIALASAWQGLGLSLPCMKLWFTQGTHSSGNTSPSGKAPVFTNGQDCP